MSSSDKDTSPSARDVAFLVSDVRTAIISRILENFARTDADAVREYKLLIALVHSSNLSAPVKLKVDYFAFNVHIIN